ncbi:glycosyltransferase [Ruegeria sp. PrR005]|uniref:Glycosyltransferase n=1 Tax=Ruegeria sp. PrR005 TaxID=2706882 RepID=A0A6B2NLR2_9RHOB|nr:glycosyltransferase [Ruegeria sp. PrR005]NDW44150.1 glycosyltransferase [Ruegeria sp. PrR005]
MSAEPIIALFPEASFGAALNCVGIAQALRERGGRPVFICHPGFTGVFAEYGFQEYHLPVGDQSRENADDYWQRFIQTHLPNFRKDAWEQLDTYVAPTWDAIVNTVEKVEDALSDLLSMIQPDAILLDNVIMFPAVARANCPWVRVVSCAETELPDANVPPYLSGLKPESTVDRKRFERTYERAVRSAHKRYNRFRKKRGLDPLAPAIFLEPSPDLNLLLAPSAVRYHRKIPLCEPQFVYLEGCVRNETKFDFPHLKRSDTPLVYMSFGSLGAIDTGIITRMLNVFSSIQAQFLVNVGGFLESYGNVPDNVLLGSWFPQPSVVAECDLFIHHGGNNSFCEALYFGVPSLLLPYCWDGFDNAQRAEATGTGRWLDRNNWSEAKLKGIVESMLASKDMKARLASISTKMQSAPGPVKSADAIMSMLARNQDAVPVG